VANDDKDDKGTENADAAKAEVRSLISEVLDEKLEAFGTKFKLTPQRTSQGTNEAPSVWQRLFGA
jgi:hypothetical protein